MALDKKEFKKPVPAKEEADEDEAESVEDEEESEVEDEEEQPVRASAKKAVKASGVELVEVTKETELAFRLPDGRTLSMHGYLVWLGNQVREVKEAIAGGD